LSIADAGRSRLRRLQPSVAEQRHSSADIECARSPGFVAINLPPGSIIQPTTVV
jgi:hypothetical protein